MQTIDFLDKNFKTHQADVYHRLHREHGDIIRLGFMGQPPVVMPFNPEDVKTVYKADGKYPFQPGFDIFRYYRKHMRSDLYPDIGRNSFL